MILKQTAYLGYGTAWGGHLSCKEEVRWVQFPHIPLETARMAMRAIDGWRQLRQLWRGI